MNNKRKGSDGERIAKKLLEAAGYVCTKAAASLGAVDLIAIGPTGVRCIQVKVSSSSEMLQPARLQAVRETLYDLPRPANLTYEIWVRHKQANKWRWYTEVVR